MRCQQAMSASDVSERCQLAYASSFRSANPSHNSIRVGKKECPSCRLHLPSRRSLRADPNFDALLVAMLGDVNALDEEEAKVTEAQNRELNFNNALTKSQQVGIQQQNINRKKVKISTPRSVYNQPCNPQNYTVHRQPSQPNQYSRSTSAPTGGAKRPNTTAESTSAKRRMEGEQLWRSLSDEMRIRQLRTYVVGASNFSLYAQAACKLLRKCSNPFYRNVCHAMRRHRSPPSLRPQAVQK